MILKLLVLFAVFVLAKSQHCDKTSTLTPKTYVIDLDKPPKDRFTAVATDFTVQMEAFLAYEKKQLGIDEAVMTIIEEIATKIDDYIPYPFNEEMRGIALATGANLGDIVLTNLIYDLTAHCTGVLAQQPDGKIIHGRNLDYNFTPFLINVTYVAQYIRKGELLFSTVQFAGYLGVLTGHRQNYFTFEINERDQGEWWINYLFAIFDKKASPVAFLARRLFENATSYDDAVTQLMKTDLIAPVYFIVGGSKPGEAAIITRDQDHMIDIWHLNSTTSSIGSWYILETNYDHWLPPPPNDDRRTPAIIAMNKTTQANINFDTLMDVMVLQPVCNVNTVYSVVMSAADKDFQLIVH